MPIPSTAPSPMTCWMYLVRHGATCHNEQRPPRFQGQGLNEGLAEAGCRQALRTGQFLREIPFARVYSSPLRRALETAEAIARPRGLATVPLEPLSEVDVGLWEGLTWPEIVERHPDAARSHLADPIANPYLGGETVADVRQRATPVLLDLMARHRGESIAVVAHSVVNRSFLAHLLSEDLTQFRLIPQDNCGINILRLQEDTVRIATVNSVFHLID